MISVKDVVNYNPEEYKFKSREIPSDLLAIIIYAYMQKVKDLGSDTTLYEIGYEVGRLVSPKSYEDIKKFLRPIILVILRLKKKITEKWR